MQLGVPVVTSNVSALPEVAGAAALLVNPERPAEVTSALLEILRDPELSNVLARRGYLQSKRFSWQAVGEQTLQVLHAAAAQGVGVVKTAAAAAEVL